MQQPVQLASATLSDNPEAVAMAAASIQHSHGLTQQLLALSQQQQQLLAAFQQQLPQHQLQLLQAQQATASVQALSLRALPQVPAASCSAAAPAATSSGQAASPRGGAEAAPAQQFAEAGGSSPSVNLLPAHGLCIAGLHNGCSAASAYFAASLMRSQAAALLAC